MSEKERKELKEDIGAVIETTCFWEGIDLKDMVNFKIAISPHNEVYCSPPNGDWYDEYTPDSDWKTFKVKNYNEAIAVAENM